MKFPSFSGAVVFILMGIALVSCFKPKTKTPKTNRNEAVPVTIAKVEVVPMDKTLSVVGTLYPKDDATVSAEVEGKVEKTMAEFGDRLKNGQEIALIDTTSYDALLQQAAANVVKAKAAAANAEQNLKRIQTLQKEKISSTSDLDATVAAAEQARAEVQAVEAAAAIAKLNLQRSRVKAPFDSAVAERIASAGDYMKVGSPLFHIVNDGVLKFIVQAPESYAGQV
ncbi:MAG: efflux RND transporter periplasmic adaptor subunit, partial [Limisphaerales bacterium]